MVSERSIVIRVEKQGLRLAKQSDGEILVGEFPGGMRFGEIDIEEKFHCVIGGDGCGGVGVREKIGGFLEARGGKVEAAKVMPNKAGFVVEGSRLDGRRRNARDIASEGEHIGGNVAVLGEVERQRRRRRRRRRRRKGGGAEFGVKVGEVDVGVLETVIEFP